jgi:hypothetical protein
MGSALPRTLSDAHRGVTSAQRKALTGVSARQYSTVRRVAAIAKRTSHASVAHLTPHHRYCVADDSASRDKNIDRDFPNAYEFASHSQIAHRTILARSRTAPNTRALCNSAGTGSHSDSRSCRSHIPRAMFGRLPCSRLAFG